jgi:hypothetical protein
MQRFALKTFKLARNNKAMLSKLIDTKIEMLEHFFHPNIVSFHELLDANNGQHGVLYGRILVGSAE